MSIGYTFHYHVRSTLGSFGTAEQRNKHCIFSIYITIVFIFIFKYLLLAECEVCTASYGPSFFLPFIAQVRSTQAMKTKEVKTEDP